MIINENEFGAPWNDQFYDVTFYFRMEINGVEFKSEQLENMFVLSGPKYYDYDELKSYAHRHIYENYYIDDADIIILNINEH